MSKGKDKRVCLEPVPSVIFGDFNSCKDKCSGAPLSFPIYKYVAIVAVATAGDSPFKMLFGFVWLRRSALIVKCFSELLRVSENITFER